METSADRRWKKVDLHVHTPASRCYRVRTDTPDDIVAFAVQRDLSAIAITDHNSPEWIDRVKSAAEERGLIIFPGVELSLQQGCHLVALFDPAVGRDHVTAFLGKVNIAPQDYGADGTMCSMGIGEVLSAIHSFGGLAILAHIDGPKGAFLSQIRDRGGKTHVPQECCKFFNEMDYDGVETLTGRLPELFDETHQFNRTPAVLRASDNPDPEDPTKHSKLGIGSKYAWLKMDDISLGGLRQCLLDPRTRICVDETCPEFTSPWIRSMKISGGFFDGEIVDFTAGMNALIGAQGSGKSLLIEFLRFGLDQLCDREPLRQDIVGKLRDRLKPGGKVSITVNKNGETYRIERMLPLELPASVSSCWNRICDAVTVIQDANGTVPDVKPKLLFPIQAYSQGEIVLATRESAAQRRLIDETLDLSSLESRLQSVTNRLRANTNALANVIDAGASINVLENRLRFEQGEVRRLTDQLASKWFTKIEKWHDVGRRANQSLTSIKSLEQDTKKWLLDLHPDAVESVPPLDADSAFASVARIADLEAQVRTVITRALNVAAKQIAELVLEADGLAARWTKELTATESQYDDFLATVGGDKQQINASLIQHRKVESEINRSLSEETARVRQRDELRDNRAQLLAEFDIVRKEISEARRIHYAEVSRRTAGVLRVTLEEGSERSGYIERVAELIKGSRIHRNTVESLCNSVSPSELADIVLYANSGKTGAQMRVGDVSTSTVNDIVSYLRQQPSKSLLALAHDVPCEDKPLIEYRVDGRKYRALEGLSAGQQMTALQMIILSIGDQPVVIDQPEDSIDTTTVYQNIVQQLRSGKLNRQFVLSSHNPNIVVTGDADRISVLRSSADRGTIARSGGLDRESVRADAIEHLEGGEEPLRIRTRKYGFN